MGSFDLKVDLPQHQKIATRDDLVVHAVQPTKKDSDNWERNKEKESKKIKEQRLDTKIGETAEVKVETKQKQQQPEDLKKYNFRRGYASGSVTLSNNIVTKTKKSMFKELYVHEREICVLQLLQQFSWSPRLISHSDTTISTSFAGYPITEENIPTDYKEQFQSILDDMKSIGMRHNDIIYPCTVSDDEQAMKKNKVKREVMVLDGRLSLVDFGLSTINEEVPCNFTHKKFPGSWTPCPDVKMMDLLDKLAEKRNIMQGAAAKAEKHHEGTGRDWEAHLCLDYTSQISLDKLKEVLPPTVEVTDIIKRDGMKDEVKRFDMLQQFYGVPVRDDRFLYDHTIYLLNDTAPVYDFRSTTKGQRRVNVNIMDTKRYFRKVPIRVHATDNIQETRENMECLGLGAYPSKPKFETMDDVFYALNNDADPNFKYVVLRNFDGLPKDVAVDEHFDLDILVSDYYSAKRILDAYSSTGDRYEDGVDSKGRIQNKFDVGDSTVQTDIRFVGDGYYDEAFERDILESRVKFNDAVFVPSETNHKFSLMYHALVQKPSMSMTYKTQMQLFFGTTDVQSLKQELTIWLDSKGYSVTRPKDPSVFFKPLSP